MQDIDKVGFTIRNPLSLIFSQLFVPYHSFFYVAICCIIIQIYAPNILIQNFYAANFYAPNIFVSQSWMISLQTKVVWITLYNVKFTYNNPISENFRLQRAITFHFYHSRFTFLCSLVCSENQDSCESNFHYRISLFTVPKCNYFLCAFFQRWHIRWHSAWDFLVNLVLHDAF